MANNENVTTSTTTRKYPTLMMLLITLAFFLPAAAFPITDIFVRAIWTGRPAGTLPFPPIILSFITGGASILINCGFVIFVHTETAYLYFTCANMSCIILFLFGNFERMVDAPYMSNVPPEAWGIDSFYFTILFISLQLSFNSALRSCGKTDKDLGAFFRITNCIGSSLSNGGNGGLQGHSSLAGNMDIHQQSTASPPPAYE